MLLVELPPELLIVIFESIPDIRTLYKLIRTCTYAREIYLKDPISIAQSILQNAHPELSQTVQDIISASRSNGELDYAYISRHSIKWTTPEGLDPWRPLNCHAERSINLLQDLANLENDTSNIAEWCTPLCQFKPTWKILDSHSINYSVQNTILQLQLVTNRMYNVVMPAFPEPLSVRRYERERGQRSISQREAMKPSDSPLLEDKMRSITPPHLKHTYISRKTREQAKDLMKDLLRTISLPQLRNMWFLMQILQDQYLVLRRHRLRPKPDSLMDLLFEHSADEHAWNPSPWFAVQSLLSDMGMHVVPARPSTAFRFLGNEVVHELEERDVAEFEHFLESSRLSACFPGSHEHDQQMSKHLGKYLERFRPLLGLPYFDRTPIVSLVEHQAPIRSTVGANRYWAQASSTSVSQSRLAELLQQSGEENKKRVIMGSKQRLRSARQDSVPT